MISNNWEEFEPEDYWRAVVVLAENEERALEIAKKGRKKGTSSGFDIESNNWEFKMEQYPLNVVEIDTGYEQVILTN